MKIHEYNEMMAYLLRPAQEAKLVDDLEPGSLKDELLKDFDPSQETYEEYLQRKSMRENAAYGGRMGFDVGGAPLTMDVINSITNHKDFSDVLKNYKKLIKNIGYKPISNSQLFEIWSRENMAQGGVIGEGGMFKGEDMGTREGFNIVSPNNLAKSEASYKAYEDKFGKSTLNKMSQSQYNKNFRDLDKTNELKFFKSQVNKYEDFIKQNKRYPNKSEAYRIGLVQSGKRQAFDFFGDDIREVIKTTYSSGEGGSPYIANKLSKEPYNFKVDEATIRRFITAEEAAGNIVRPEKFKTQEANPDLPKDRYNKIREVTDRDLKGFKVGRTQTEVLAPEGSRYKITFNIPGSPETTKIPFEYQGTQYFKTKAQADKAIAGSKKFSKDFIKQGKANRGLREIISERVSDRNIESRIVNMKQGEDLATAHRVSYKQIGKLGELYNILNLGVEDPDINSGAIRKFENKLDNLYKEQNNLIKTARRSTNKGIKIPNNIQKKIDAVNKEISAVVDLTNQRVQGILVDAKTLKPYTYGVNYIKTYGMGFLDNKPVKEITDADLETIELNLKNQIDREKKLGQETASFLRDRQPLLKYTKELSEPGFLSKIPAKLRPIALATGITIGGISAAGAADGTTEQGFSTGEKLAGAGVAGGAYAARKPILSRLGKIAKPVGKALGAPSLAAGLAISELAKGEDANLGVAGADLLLPELTKQAGVRGVLANPFQLAEKFAKYGRIGKGIASIARVPAMFTPVGLGLMGIEGVRMGMREQDRINEMKLNEPEKYQEYLDELESYEDFSA